MDSSENVTELLRAWGTGDNSALERLAPIVHAELHRIASAKMARERGGHLLQPTALVNEAFLRIVRSSQSIEWANRSQFYFALARLMREILIEFARAQKTTKRGDRAAHIPLEEVINRLGDPVGEFAAEELITLDVALTKLAELDARQAQVVELRFFGGLDNSEIADALKVSEQTVIRDWRAARAWLYGVLN